MKDTPLGEIISIRLEKDPKVIKSFGPNEKKIRASWIKFKTRTALDNMSTEEKKRRVSAFQKAMKDAFFKGGKKGM